MPDVERRALHLLVPDVDSQAILATADGALPRLDVELEAGETTVLGGRRALLATWGVAPPILEIQFDLEVAQEDLGADGVPTLLAFEAPPDGWSPPAGLVWRPLGDPDPDVADGLRPWLARLLAERRASVPPPPLRPRWARSGWYERATTWMGAQLAEMGRPPIGPIEQVRHWGISALMRVDTAGGRVWFKAVFPGFAHEPVVSQLLHDRCRGAVTPVLAIDAEEGWLLLDDVGADILADHPEHDAAAVRRLVEIQRAFVDRTDELVGVGCRHRPFGALAQELATVLADPTVLEHVELTASRTTELVVWVDAAATELADLSYPDTLVHGDFHPGNVHVVDGEPVLIDWSDAAISHPLVDTLTWKDWFPDEPERTAGVWDAVVEAWADVCPVADVTRLRPQLEGVIAAYHTVSYAGIVIELEGPRRVEHADGLQSFLAHLDAAVPR